jgi:hypothetical protein
MAGIVHREDPWRLCRGELTGGDVAADGWDIRGRWLGGRGGRAVGWGAATRRDNSTARDRHLDCTARSPRMPRRISPTSRRTARGCGGYAVNMDVADAAAVWTPYQARPGRRVLVVKDLADLRGPASGKVTLPLRLFWSPPGRVFDLDDPFMLRSMYQVVLGEAIRAGELTAYLNRDRLLAVWRDLYLPKGVRRAWEELHPALRAAATAPAA